MTPDIAIEWIPTLLLYGLIGLIALITFKAIWNS